MKSEKRGEHIFKLEVTNIDSRGFWLFIDGREFYLDYSMFPWFLNAPVKHIINVKMEAGNSLYWPELDVDLTIEMIEHPERFPLKAKCVDLVAEGSSGYIVGHSGGNNMQNESNRY